ncbi:MAG: glycoside hydrolase family 16 protein [Flavobacteriales bacterium]|nr:glycoside hydrolase family 16 protein [Flavobacteriales bacterium]
MERFGHLLIILALSTTCRAQAPSQWWWFMEDTLERYVYAGGDEFSGGEVDGRVWTNSSDGRRNHHGTHMQDYNTDGRNFVLGDGTLRIQLRREDVTARGIEYEGDSARLGDGGPNLRTWKYTSGMLVSREPYQFGLFEARIRLPKGQGAWPSFWLFGGQPNEEFDILEAKGEKTDQFHVDVHCPGRACVDYRNPLGKFGLWLGVNWKAFGLWKRASGDLAEGFNDYMGEWRPDALRWYLNGEQCAEWEGALLVPERIILQNALANTCKGCPFGPGPEDPMEPITDMVVDHVRIWRELAAKDVVERSGAVIEPRFSSAMDEVQTVDSSDVVRYDRPAEQITVRGGKRGRVKKGFKAKVFPDVAKGVLRLEITGQVPKSAFLIIQQGGRIFTPKHRLRPGTFTVTLSAAGPGTYDVIVGHGGRSAGERIILD